MPQLIKVTTADIITRKRIELAELEAKLADERRANRPKVGDYARVLLGGSDITVGTVVTVTQVEPVDYDGSLPFEVASVLLPEVDAEWVTEIELLTPAEAKSVLLAQVEALFNVEEADESREVSTK